MSEGHEGAGMAYKTAFKWNNSDDEDGIQLPSTQCWRIPPIQILRPLGIKMMGDVEKQANKRVGPQCHHGGVPYSSHAHTTAVTVLKKYSKSISCAYSNLCSEVLITEDNGSDPAV